MKRENFTITYNGEQVIKHKWNSSLREIEAIVRQIARDECAVYNLIDKESTKGETGFVAGYRTWQSTSGKTIRFDIKKVETVVS